MSMRLFQLLAVRVAFAFSTLLFAQTTPVTVSRTDLTPLVGDWAGTMLTLEPNDSKLMHTDVDWKVTESDSGFVMAINYWDESGNRETDTDLIAESHGGRRVYYDGKAWMLYAKTVTQNGTTLVFQGQGQDDHKNAQIINVLYMSKPGTAAQDSVVLTKKVLYENAGTEITRSQFRLGRKTGE